MPNAAIIWDINPVLLELGPLEIRYYGILFALGLTLAYLLARHMCKIKKLSLEKFDSLAIYLVIGLIIGARFGHIVFYELDYYLAHPVQIIQVWRGGLASHGATIGLMTAYALFLFVNRKDKKIRTFTYADILAVAITIPVGLVRLGNFFNSEIVGRTSDLPWAVKFLRVDELTRHPSQIYEFFIGVILLTILYPLWQKKHSASKPGFFLGLFMILYFTLRFFVEFVKEYPLHENVMNLTTGQLLSVPFIIFGILLLTFTPSPKKAQQ